MMKTVNKVLLVSLLVNSGSMMNGMDKVVQAVAEKAMTLAVTADGKISAEGLGKVAAEATNSYMRNMPQPKEPGFLSTFADKVVLAGAAAATTVVVKYGWDYYTGEHACAEAKEKLENEQKGMANIEQRIRLQDLNLASIDGDFKRTIEDLASLEDTIQKMGTDLDNYPGITKEKRAEMIAQLEKHRSRRDFLVSKLHYGYTEQRVVMVNGTATVKETVVIPSLYEKRKTAQIEKDALLEVLKKRAEDIYPTQKGQSAASCCPATRPAPAQITRSAASNASAPVVSTATTAMPASTPVAKVTLPAAKAATPAAPTNAKLPAGKPAPKK